jgi:hypothetical protein
VSERQIRVFLSLHPVGHHRAIRWSARWISRGTSSNVYSSRGYESRDVAIVAARKWLAKHPNIIDTSKQKWSPEINDDAAVTL